LQEAIKKKLQKVRRLGCVTTGSIKSLTSFFDVAKRADDIRMMYDGAKNGLNDAMWAPRFALPAIESHLRFVTTNTFLDDIDIGNMFLNFVMHERLQVYAGIDLTAFFPEELLDKSNAHNIWERWCRCSMGFKNSPYNAVQAILMVEDLIRGDPFNPSNVFRGDNGELN
jgi:hypothetical protein